MAICAIFPPRVPVHAEGRAGAQGEDRIPGAHTDLPSVGKMTKAGFRRAGLNGWIVEEKFIKPPSRRDAAVIHAGVWKIFQQPAHPLSFGRSGAGSDKEMAPAVTAGPVLRVTECGPVQPVRRDRGRTKT